MIHPFQPAPREMRIPRPQLPPPQAAGAPPEPARQHVEPHAGLQGLAQRRGQDKAAPPGRNTSTFVWGSVVSPLRNIPTTVDFGHLPIGTATAGGAFKTAHPVFSATGRATGQILLIERSPMLHNIPGEISCLIWLAERGFPVAPVHACGYFRGHSAMLMPEMLGVFKPGIVQHPAALEDFVRSALVNRQTVRSLQRILRQMDRYNISITDLQMLLDPADGKLYITDPQGISQGRTQEMLFAPPGVHKLGTRKPLNYMLERLYQRFPDMRA